MTVKDSVPIVWGVSALAFAPLVSVPWIIFPHIAARGLFVVVVGSIVIALGITWCVRKQCRFRPRIFFAFFLLYVFWMLFTSLTGVHPVQSILPSYERMDSWLTLAILFGVFSVLFLPFFSSAVWRRLLIITLAVGGLVASVALVEALAQLPQSYPTSFFGNPTIVASFLVMQPFLALYAFLHARRVSTKYALVALALIEIAVVFLSSARGALIALVVGIVWAASTHLFILMRLTLKRALLIFVVFAVLLGAAGVILSSTSVVTPFSNAISQEVASLSREPRVFLWNTAFEGFVDRPFLGRGYRSFDAVFEQHYQQPFFAQESWSDSAHNNYLDILVDGGVIGLAFYLLFFISALYSAHKHLLKFTSRSARVDPRLYLIGGIIAYLINIIFIFSSLIPTLIALAILAHLLSHLSPWDVVKSAVAHPTGRRPVLAFTWGVALVIVFFSVSSFIAGSVTAYGSNNSLPSTTRLAAFRLARTVPTFDSYGLDIAIAENAIHSKLMAHPPLFGLSEGIIFTQPGASRRLYAEGVYFFSLNELTSAETLLEAAKERMPRHPLIRNTLGEVYLAGKKYDNALGEYRAAYTLLNELPGTSDFQFYIDDARKRYAAALVYSNRQEEAEELLARHYGDAFIPYTPELLAAFDMQKNEGRVLSLLGTAQAQEPSNPQHCFSFAAAQLKFEHRQRSLDVLEGCAQKFPETRSEAETLIRAVETNTIDINAL